MSQLEKDLQHRATKKELVWRYLAANMGEWVDAHVLTHPAVGGSEGLRRLRELRAECAPHYRIEKRRKKIGDGLTHTWQYRLVRVTME